MSRPALRCLSISRRGGAFGPGTPLSRALLTFNGTLFQILSLYSETMLRTSITAVTRAAPRHVRGIARVAPIAVSHATSTGSRAAGTIKTDQGLELKTDLQKEVRPRFLRATVQLDDRVFASMTRVGNPVN